VSQGLLEALIGSNGKEHRASPALAVKALAWARVSTDMQEERGLSLPEQLREIRQYAEKQGIEIVEEFSEATSAFQKESRRVEFHRMVVAAKADRQVSMILVHDFSRFSRDSVRAKALVRELRQSGVKVFSLNDPETDPETVAGVYMEAITFAKNEAFSREIAFHTRKGCRANVQTRDKETGWCYKNGGQPLFGYKTVQLHRGEEKRGRPIMKSIWVLDDTVIDGRPVHEWARECLLMAAQGASLDSIRDFLHAHNIPAPRKQYWGNATLYYLVEPYKLMEYAGYAVWNVHRKNGSERPASEWIVVENAHPPLISEEEAKTIAEARARQRQQKSFDTGYHKSRSSTYLLTGGLFQCERCGANMVGFRKSDDRRYYVCGSEPYRKGLGCGPGIYVPQQALEAEVLTGVKELLGVCANAKGLTRQVNEDLRQAWEESRGHDPHAAQRLAETGAKIANIRNAIENGLMDAAWANERLPVLLAERERLLSSATVVGSAPQIDINATLAYRRQTEQILSHGEPQDKKQLMRKWVAEMKLAPEKLEVEITYRLPEPVMNTKVAGAVFASDYYNQSTPLITAHWIYELAKQGAREMRRVGIAV